MKNPPSSSRAEPWFAHRWPWFLFGGPLVVVIASLAPHFGPVIGSLSFASTRISIGAWLFLMNESVARSV